MSLWPGALWPLLAALAAGQAPPPARPTGGELFAPDAIGVADPLPGISSAGDYRSAQGGGAAGSACCTRRAALCEAAVLDAPSPLGGGGASAISHLWGRGPTHLLCPLLPGRRGHEPP